jgi:CDP-glucose 4,6-dehydratase
VQNPEASPPAINFGPAPDAFRSVSDVVDQFSAGFDGAPGWVADNAPAAAEASFLTLSSALAEEALGWRPTLSLETALAWTADWYKAHRRGDDMIATSLAQIEQFRDLQTPEPVTKIGAAR